MMNNIKALIFDYGGTIDTPALHWSEVFWLSYQKCQPHLTKEQFREAYVYAERTLANENIIAPHHRLIDLLRIKLDLQTGYLDDCGYMQLYRPLRIRLADDIARSCFDYVKNVMETTRPVLQRLANRYPIVLVTNFYGNINTILDEFQLTFFREIIESAVVGVRKPDPRIFQLGVEALGLAPTEVAVIGDSYSKDIVPAKSIGCHTVWFKGIGWTDEQHDSSAADVIIDSFNALEDVFLSSDNNNLTL